MDESPATPLRCDRRGLEPVAVQGGFLALCPCLGGMLARATPPVGASALGVLARRPVPGVLAYFSGFGCKGPGPHATCDGRNGPGSYFDDFWYSMLKLELSYSVRYFQRLRYIVMKMELSFSLRYGWLLHLYQPCCNKL